MLDGVGDEFGNDGQRGESGPYTATAYEDAAIPASAWLPGSIADARLWRVAGDTAYVIAAIHQAGVIHCVIKPSNVLITPRRVRIIDFGIAASSTISAMMPHASTTAAAGGHRSS
jgi:serine/threonine protein kinase